MAYHGLKLEVNQTSAGITSTGLATTQSKQINPVTTRCSAVGSRMRIVRNKEPSAATSLSTDSRELLLSLSRIIGLCCSSLTSLEEDAHATCAAARRDEAACRVKLAHERPNSLIYRALGG